MKKVLFLLLVSISFASLAAGTLTKVSLCPFTDTFDITGATIQKLSADGNLVVHQVNSTEFTDGCANNDATYDGNIYLTVAYKKGFCSLTIVDGPFEQNPYVSNSSCKGGMQFNGIDHQTGTYQYTLKFSN